MKPRQTVLDLFSTFIQFAQDRFHSWRPDGRLRRNLQVQMQTMEAGGTDLSEGFWVLYWYRVWAGSGDRLSMGHLSAYLQEPCYWATQRLVSATTGGAYALADCFQMAIAEVPTVLKGYNAHQGAALKTYAKLCFSNVVRDRLRQQGEADSRSTWGLLRKVSQKRLTEALRGAGYSEDKIADYRLAWSCFKTYCADRETPGTRQLARPDRATWEAIAQLYQTQRSRQVGEGGATVAAEQIEQWLILCASRVRAYLHPTSLSLNAQKWDEGAGELQDDLPDSPDATPLQMLLIQEEVQERQHHQQQIDAVLVAALEGLAPDLKTLLNLYYSQQLTQQAIARQLEVKQYTISRRLSRAKETLLLAIARWSQATLHISLTSPALNDMNLGLEEWLQHHLSPSSKFGLNREV